MSKNVNIFDKIYIKIIRFIIRKLKFLTNNNNFKQLSNQNLTLRLKSNNIETRKKEE